MSIAHFITAFDKRPFHVPTAMLTNDSTVQRFTASWVQLTHNSTTQMEVVGLEDGECSKHSSSRR